MTPTQFKVFMDRIDKIDDRLRRVEMFIAGLTAVITATGFALKL